MTVHPSTSSSTLGISALWAYQYPHLLIRSIDRLFAEWGNVATYRLVPYTKGEIRIAATRCVDGTITSEYDQEVARAKILIGIDEWVQEFVTEYRATNAWIVEQYDTERAQNLDLVAA